MATVDQDGNVTAIAFGSAVITATSGTVSSICNVKVSPKAEMQYTGSTTGNMVGNANNASTVGLNETIFSVEAGKGDNSNFPGLNANGEIRLYKSNGTGGTFFVVTIGSAYTITDIRINFVSGSQCASVYAGTQLVTENEHGFYVINGRSFKVQDTGNDTIKIDSIEISYRDANARELVERTNTSTQLSYHYSGNAQDGFEFSNISIRFGGNVAKTIWDELDTENHLITGFGVMIADGDIVKNDKDFADAIEIATPASVSTDISTEYAVDYFVPVANMASIIGEDENNYFWNLRWSIDSANMDKMYSAVAYIKVGDEYVVMNMARESVETMATKYIASGNYSGAVADSLQYIVDHAQQA